MATTATCLFPFEVSHEADIHPLYSHGQFFGLVLFLYSAIYYSLVDVMDFVCHLPCSFLQWVKLHCILVRYCLYHASSCKNCSKRLLGILYDDLVLFIMDGLFWANLFFIVGGELFGGLFFTLPFEGITFVAQDQHTLYTDHKWREGHHGVSYDAYQVQIFSPP